MDSPATSGACGPMRHCGSGWADAAVLKVEREFDAAAVVARIDALYGELVASERERTSHASGAGRGTPASERGGGSGGAKPPGKR